MAVRHLSAGMVAAVLWTSLALVPRTGHAQHATPEEIDAAVKFYDSVKADPKKHNAYCNLKQGIEMMTSGPAQFAEAKQKMAAATKQLGPELAKAQELSTRLDPKSESTKQYASARQALEKTCP